MISKSTNKTLFRTILGRSYGNNDGGGYQGGRMNQNNQSFDLARSQLMELNQSGDGLNIVQLLQSVFIESKHVRNIEMSQFVREDVVRNALQVIHQSLDELPDQSLIQVSFVLRKVVQYKCRNLISRDFQMAYIQKINNLVASQSLYMNQLVNLFFNVSIVQLPCQQISRKLNHELQENMDTMEPHQIEMIIGCCANRRPLHFTQTILLNNIFNNYQGFFTEFSNESKAGLFLKIAKLQMENQVPIFRSPRIMQLLKQDLKENLDQMSEKGILFIIEAFQYVSLNFPKDLLIEIQGMISMTLEHNPENIQVRFIIRYLSLICDIEQTANFRVNPQHLELILNYAAGFIKTTDQTEDRVFLQRQVLLLVNTLNRMRTFIFDHSEFNQVLCDFVLHGDQTNNFTVIQFLHKEKVDISYIMRTGLEQGKFDQFSPESIHRAIKCVTEADLQEQLRALPNYKELANCQFYQFTLKECMPFFHEEHLQIFDLLKAEIMESEEKHRLFRQFQDVVQLLKSRKLVTERREEIRELVSHIPNNMVHRLVSSMTTQPNHMDLKAVESLLLNKKDQTYFHIPILTNLLFNNKFASLVFQNDYQFISLIFANFVNNLRNDNIENPSAIVGQIMDRFIAICSKLENNNNNTSNIVAMMSTLQPYINVSTTPVYVLEKMSLLLIDGGFMNSDLSIQVMEVILNRGRVNYNIKTEIALFIARDSAPNVPQEVDSIVHELLEENLEKLGNLETHISMLAASRIMQMPGQYSDQHLDRVDKVIDDQLQFIRKVQLQNLINTFHLRMNDRLFRENRTANHILRRVMDFYSTFEHRLTLKTNIKCLAVCSKFRIRKAQVYTTLISNLSRQFNNLNGRDLGLILSYLGRIGYSDSEFTDRILMAFQRQPRSIRKNQFQIYQALFDLGHRSELVIERLDFFLTTNQSKSFNIFVQVQYLLTLKLDREVEQEYLSQLLNKEIAEKDKHSITKINRVSYQCVKSILKGSYPEQDFESKLESMFTFSEQDIDLELSIFKSSDYVKDTLTSYLQVMQLEVEMFKEVDSVLTFMYLPKVDKYINVISNMSITFDKHSMTGRGILIQRVQDNLTSQGASFVNVRFHDFLGADDDLSKINYLNSVGIESQTESYDFSSLGGGNNQSQGLIDDDLILNIEDSVDLLAEFEDSEETDISGNQDDMMEASEDLDDESTPEVTSEQTGSDSETTQQQQSCQEGRQQERSPPNLTKIKPVQNQAC